MTRVSPRKGRESQQRGTKNQLSNVQDIKRMFETRTIKPRQRVHWQTSEWTRLLSRLLTNKIELIDNWSTCMSVLNFIPRHCAAWSYTPLYLGKLIRNVEKYNDRHSIRMYGKTGKARPFPRNLHENENNTVELIFSILIERWRKGNLYC